MGGLAAGVVGADEQADGGDADEEIHGGAHLHGDDAHDADRGPRGDEGRGQGLAQIRKFVAKWNGKLTVRSGSARVAIIPGWDEDEPLQESLPYFPGSQMQIVIPEKVPDNATATLSNSGTAGRSSRARAS